MEFSKDDPGIFPASNPMNAETYTPLGRIFAGFLRMAVQRVQIYLGTGKISCVPLQGVPDHRFYKKGISTGGTN